MLLPDVNILIHAFREESADHVACRRWLEDVVIGEERFALLDLVCSGFLRIVTNPAIQAVPSSLSDAMAFLDEIRAEPTHFWISPGERHWRIFTDLCRAVEARGNVIPDAYFAAVAIETGSDWITLDRGFARFPGLRWRRPF
ncbi:MAG: type II toxin-antitoxin system VapC family toxin [Dehalococcoidia bacterium]